MTKHDSFNTTLDSVDTGTATTSADPSTGPLRPLVGARLTALGGPVAGSTFDVGLSESLIGRRDPAEIVLNDRAVSSRHARLVCTVSDEGDEPTAQYLLEDLGSKNGTFLNGRRLEQNKLVSLAVGDRMRVGSTVLLFSRHDPVEEQLLQSRKMEALGRLAGGVAHDFNNLLGALLGNVNYLQAQPPTTEELAECLADMEAATRRGMELTMQLLGFARGGSSDIKPIDVREVIEQTMRLLERTFDRAISVRSHIDDGLCVLADRSQLQQVLMNVCINARDAMPGGGELSLSAALTTIREDSNTAAFLSDGNYVRLRVGDSGCGMDSATVERAFDPFFTTKPRGEGTGLGLATVYGIVSDHGGHVELESELLVGTTVTIYLPALDPSIRPEPPQPSQHETDRIGGVVLVIDDEEPVRRSTQRLLKRFGFEVLCADDGAQGLAIFEAHRELIDLVLLDVIMPEMAGDEVYERLREIDPEQPVVLMTGYAPGEQSRRLVNQSGLDVLKKPFDADQLRAAVTAHIRRHDP
ncbi:MAG: response regulator [Myxococcales bacterium]|nr:response regulator [Myxococcales bacterium]